MGVRGRCHFQSHLELRQLGELHAKFRLLQG